MAGSSIGNLSIVISGNASGLTAALTSAQKQIAAFQQKANAATGNLGQKFLPQKFGNAGLGSSFDQTLGKPMQRMWDSLQRGAASSQAGVGQWSKLVGSHFDVAGAKQQKFVAQSAAMKRLMDTQFSQPGAFDSTRVFGRTGRLMETAGTTAGRSFMGAMGAAFSTAGSVGAAVASVASWVGDVFGQVSTIGVGFATAAGSAIKQALSRAMDFQQMSVAFEVMTGSADKGRTMLESLERFAATTPFEPERIYRSAQKLAGAGIEMRNVLPVLQSMAAVVSATGGDAQRFENMAVAISQVRAVGHLMGQERHQLTDAGFAMEHVAKALNTDIGGVYRLGEQGAIGINDLYRAFNLATREGGKFDGILTRMAGTTKGQFLQLQSQLGIAVRKIGEGFRQGTENSGITTLLFGAIRELDAHIPMIQTKLANFGKQLPGLFLDGVQALGEFTDKIQPMADFFNAAFVRPWIIGMGAIHHGLLLIAGTMDELFGTSLAENTRRLFAGQAGMEFVLPEPWASMLKATGAVRLGEAPGRGDRWRKDAEDAMARLRENAGLIANDFGAIDAGSWQLSGELEKLRNKIADTTKDGFTPLEKFTKSMSKINQLATTPLGGPRAGAVLGGAVGFAAVGNPNQISRLQEDMAYREQFLDIEKSMDKFKDEFPKAMERGSVDAASAINRELYKTGAEDVQSRILRVLEQQKVDQARILKEAEEMGRFFRANPGMNLK